MLPPVPMSRVPRPLVLVVLDGFGSRPPTDDNAVHLARMPRYQALLAAYPHTELGASGRDVGLPDGQMGNSEVGHLNFGAGRIAQMDIARIDCAVADGSLGANPALEGALTRAKIAEKRLHLLCLVSDGGVHSSLSHLLALLAWAGAAGVPVVLHAFLDGRDTPPRSALRYLDVVHLALAGVGVIGTICGRYWAMDRDQRWDRVQRAYDAIVTATAPRVALAGAAVRAAYEAGKDDEFIEPTVIGDYGGVLPGDTAVFVNFRADRAREIARALTQRDFVAFPRPLGRETPFADFVCMTQYDATLPLPVAFPKLVYPDLFPDVLARHGKTQLRCAETEKFAHVTYFFDGGVEKILPGTERILVPSDRTVATYDEKPEMSADGITEQVVAAIASARFDFILVNYANPDMVGHTGLLPAAIAANEVVDRGVGALVDAALVAGGAVIVTADHGNCEQMRDPTTGEPHTAHTTNPVPFVLVSDLHRGARLRSGGRLSDVAPTMLQLLDLEKPAAMTGVSLLES